MLSDLCFRRLLWLLGEGWTGGIRGSRGLIEKQVKPKPEEEQSSGYVQGKGS